MAGADAWNGVPSVILFHIFSYLPVKDRLKASASCQQWRECLYHPNIWPLPRIKLDLVATSQNQPQAKISAFNVNVVDNLSARYNKSHRQLSSNSLIVFLERAARFLQHVSITFDPTSLENLLELAQFLTVLRSKPVAEFYGSKLRSLSLMPTSIFSLSSLQSNIRHENKQISHFNGKCNSNVNDVLAILSEVLQDLVMKSKCLEHLSLGCMDELLSRVVPQLLDKLSRSKEHRLTLQSLHLTSIKEDPDYYPVLDLKYALLAPFRNLKVLSIDYDYICDELLLGLATNQSLKKLLIYVHGVDEAHPGVSPSSWSLLAKNNSTLQVTVNVLHSYESFDHIRRNIIDTDARLVVLRLYFAGQSSVQGTEIVDLVNTVAARHQHTLKSLVIVDYFNVDVMPKLSFSRFDENPLVMLAWRCRNLERLILLGKQKF